MVCDTRCEGTSYLVCVSYHDMSYNMYLVPGTWYKVPCMIIVSSNALTLPHTVLFNSHLDMFSMAFSL